MSTRLITLLIHSMQNQYIAAVHWDKWYYIQRGAQGPHTYRNAIIEPFLTVTGSRYMWQTHEQSNICVNLKLSLLMASVMNIETVETENRGRIRHKSSFFVHLQLKLLMVNVYWGLCKHWLLAIKLYVGNEILIENEQCSW